MWAYLVHSLPFPQSYPQLLWNWSAAGFGSYFSEPQLRLLILWELSFFTFEFRCVADDAAIANTGLMLHVKHLVEHHGCGDIRRDIRCVEEPANEDRVIGRIITAKDIPGSLCRPGEFRLMNRAVEVLLIETVE